MSGPGTAPPRAGTPPPVLDGAELETGGALTLLRAGLRVTPELRVGLTFTIALAMASAIGRLTVPVLIQQILDRGVTGDDGFRPAFVYPACAGAGVLVAVVWGLSRAAFLRLVRAAEQTLYALRLRVFDHIHRLSMAEHTGSSKGALVTRVTSDIEALARFVEWGAVAWVVQLTLIVLTLVVMAVYSWQLTLVTMLVFSPLPFLFRAIQRRQLLAHDRLRSRVGEMVTEFSEQLTGAPVVRAYGMVGRSERRVRATIDRHYRSELDVAWYFAFLFPLADVFGAVALASVAGLGAWFGPGWGLGVGEVVAFFFLVTLLLTPIAELSEILDQTQTALAGWRKVLLVLATPVDVVEPEHGVELPDGPLSVGVTGLGFRYRVGPEVLSDVSVDISPGEDIAVVGETGSGKTTFAKLLARLADPTTGTIAVGGVPLREVAPVSRRARIRMVPQDGFLFDTTVGENVRYGRPSATDAHVMAAFEELGLGAWVDRLPAGLATRVGQRGEQLSVGERQLVALARAELADPGLLLLDEATSAVDPETEQALASALRRLAAGRTTISVAHRLSTAEAADRVLVFDAGRLVEEGPHDRLVDGGGTYAALHASWLGNVRAAAG